MSYKRKNWMLLIGFIVLLPILYVISFEDTLALKKHYNNLVKQKETSDNITSNILFLKQEEKYIDSILVKENVLLNNSFQQILLKKINAFKEDNDIEIVSFDNYIKVINNGIPSEIYSFAIKGDYNTLLQFVNYFERQGVGEIKSYSFKKKRSFSKRREYLTLEILLKRVLSK